MPAQCCLDWFGSDFEAQVINRVGGAMFKTQAKNVAISAGVFYLSWWIAPWGVFGFSKLTHHITYVGDFGNAVEMPLVVQLPVAVVAAAVGACVAWLVESKHPVRWVFLPALLYAFFGFRGHYWARPPMFSDRIGQAVGALFPALACICGAVAATRKRPTTESQSTPASTASQ